MMRKTRDSHNLSWFEVYRGGLLLSFLSKNDAGQRKLVEWIEPWLPFDESSYLVTVHDNTYHKLLAEYIKNGQIDSTALANEIQQCRKQRPKLLFTCLAAIRDRDVSAFNSPLKKVLNDHLKKEFGSRVASDFCIEATILWHVAQRAGITPADLGEKQAALNMTRESLGLSA
ncbi:MAG: hypothetical protein L0228_11730 [Planctomycetes bacterium]|nr:hypothetical protein [Planctomycetota bacterium]